MYGGGQVFRRAALPSNADQRRTLRYITHRFILQEKEVIYGFGLPLDEFTEGASPVLAFKNIT
jgi:hypothetical protein